MTKITSCVDKRDECKRSSEETSKTSKTTSRTRVFTVSWDKHERYRLTGHAGVRCRGGMTLIWAFVRNLRTGSVMLREKAQNGNTTRPKVPRHRPGAHCLVGAKKRGNACGAKGAGHLRQDRVNGLSGGTLCLDGSREASSGWHEPDESRGSRPDLWAAWGEIPRADPAIPRAYSPEVLQWVRPKHRHCCDSNLRNWAGRTISIRR